MKTKAVFLMMMILTFFFVLIGNSVLQQKISGNNAGDLNSDIIKSTRVMHINLIDDYYGKHNL